MKYYVIILFWFFGLTSLVAQTTIGAIPPKDRACKSGGSISTLEELLWLSENTDAWSEDWVLEANIDATETMNWNEGKGFSPIGDSPSGFGIRQEIPFSGSFDGQNFEISNLYINRPDEPYVGFFGQVSGGAIKNLNLINHQVIGLRYTGGLIGYADFSSIIDSCSTFGITEGAEVTGGLIGQIYQGVQTNYCHSNGSVSSNMWAGGLIGDNYSYSNIVNSYSNCQVSGVDYLGGLTGSNRWFSNINQCYATGSVSGSGEFAGGLVGHLDDGAIINCFATGETTAAYRIGGLIGESLFSEYSESGAYNCYSTGAVSGNGFVGGLVGRNYNYVTNCYFDTETSETDIGLGNNDSGQEAFGLITEEFINEESFNDWDFQNTWSISLNTIISPNGRPYFNWQLVNLFNIYFEASEGGSIQGEKIQTVVLGESTQAVTAVANDAYSFIEWQDEQDNIISTNPEIIIHNITETQTYTAIFELNTSIQALGLIRPIVFYPNPATNQITIITDELTIVKIIDMHAHTIEELCIFENTSLDIHHLRKGVYLIAITNSRENKTEKLIIE